MGNKNSVVTKKILVVGLPSVGKSFLIDFFAFGNSYVSMPTEWMYSQTVTIDRYTQLELREYAKIDDDTLRAEWDGLILVVKASATKEEILRSRNRLIRCWQDAPVCIIQNEIYTEPPKYSFDKINRLLQTESLPGKVLATRLDFPDNVDECHRKVIKICQFFQGT